MISQHSSDLIRRVDRLRIHCQRLVDQQLAGSYGSTFRGSGIEFEETRPYQPGDDVRAIDWRVTARSGRPFVKLFRDERQSTVYLIVDGSRSLTAPPIGPTPWDRLSEVAGVLAIVASADQHRTGMMLFTDQIEHFVPPAGGTEHAMRILRDILAWRPEEKNRRPTEKNDRSAENNPRSAVGLTNLGVPLERLCRTERRRCVAIILSDFLSEGYERALRIATAMHEVIPIVCCHPLQRTLPKCGLLTVRDPETGGTLSIDTFSRRQRAEYRAAAEAAEQRRDQLFAKLRLGSLQLSTDEDVAIKLHQFFERRRESR